MLDGLIADGERNYLPGIGIEPFKIGASLLRHQNGEPFAVGAPQRADSAAAARRLLIAKNTATDVPVVFRGQASGLGPGFRSKTQRFALV